jgi:hypothetical protein
MVIEAAIRSDWARLMVRRLAQVNATEFPTPRIRNLHLATALVRAQPRKPLRNGGLQAIRRRSALGWLVVHRTVEHRHLQHCERFNLRDCPRTTVFVAFREPICNLASIFVTRAFAAARLLAQS